MEQQKLFYSVTASIKNAPLSDYLMHGFHSKWDFYDALCKLKNRWQSRTGERISERHGFVLLRFHDTPGGRPDEEWLPLYLLQPVPAPAEPEPPDETEMMLDQAFGFDY